MNTLLNELNTQWSATGTNSLGVFAINLVLSGVFAWILGIVYNRFGTSLSNRRNFSRNFVMLAMTTMLIISIVGNSLALSLGLVGALSIVRFRAAIKEPEELAYLFFAIGIGLGMGAGQAPITLSALILICGIMIIRSLGRRKIVTNDICLHITSAQPEKVTLGNVAAILRTNCNSANLRRMDQSKERIDFSFNVVFKDGDTPEALAKQLRALDDSIKISFIDDHNFAI